MGKATEEFSEIAIHRKIVGYFGFSASRVQALETLLVAASVKSDIHAVFARFVSFFVVMLFSDYFVQCMPAFLLSKLCTDRVIVGSYDASQRRTGVSALAFQ